MPGKITAARPDSEYFFVLSLFIGASDWEGLSESENYSDKPIWLSQINCGDACNAKCYRVIDLAENRLPFGPELMAEGRFS